MINNCDFDISPESAIRQAGNTADDYLVKAFRILEDYDKFTLSDAIELTKVMAQDFHTSIMCMKMQEIRDAINQIKEE